MSPQTFDRANHVRFHLPHAIALPAFLAFLCIWHMNALSGAEGDWPRVTQVDSQPLLAATDRLTKAMELSGSPLDEKVQTLLREAAKLEKPIEVARAIQDALDPLCLACVSINPESRVKVAAGPADRQLIQHGWRTYLLKVVNEAGITAPLRFTSPQAAPIVQRSSGSPEPAAAISGNDVRDRWLDVASVNRQPLTPTLSGLPLEYRIIQIYSRDAGKREATLTFDVGQGTQDLGFRSDCTLLFDCDASSEVTLSIRDSDGEPTTAALLIRDAQGRVYPNPARRLAPDFFFHNQIYRTDGETLSLGPGTYQVTATRGPEYLPVSTQLNIEPGQSRSTLAIRLQRWIDPTQQGWFSGDHHVHAAGCAHYESPTEGVTPQDMLRHLLGEDLKVGCVLSWGPCWYYQKQFFEGRTSDLSKRDYLMRYDVEVSGFPSSHAGHLCLLRLAEDDYPGTERIEQWPSWTLPVLKWGKEQGGVVGYSHSGWGLALPDYLPDGSRAAPAPRNNEFAPRAGGKAADRLPDYALPAFDGIGANEFIVTVAHDACDFISSVDTPAIWELNIWYHTLNCGFRSRISGETDFPCIYGERVGLGRIYVQLPKDQPLSYENWVQGLKDGRSYCGDGLSHVTRFVANGTRLGWPNTQGQVSQLNLSAPGKVHVETDVAALLDEKQSPESQAIQARRLDEKPYWHLERSRIGQSRQVPVELIVNGQVIAKQSIAADGKTQTLSWDIDVPHSSWIAVRILPSVHTNPIFVIVQDQPIAASRRSAEWCRKAVDLCWERKQPLIRETERAAATEAYDYARKIYDSKIKDAKAE